MKLYLLRHGETEWNPIRKLQGTLDIPLNEKGRQIASLTGDGMKDIPIDAAVASSLSRAYETAGLILQKNRYFQNHSREFTEHLSEKEKEALITVCGCRILRDERIHEMETGPWTELFAYELPGRGFRGYWDEPDGSWLPEGVESANDMVRRAEAFLKDFLSREELRDRTVMAVTHGGFMRALLWVLSGGPEFGAQLFLNCEAAIADIDADGKVMSLTKKLFYDPALAFTGETY